MTLRVISFGGGVQSTAMLVLAVEGKLGRVDAALFCNVGDDSEHPDTIRFVRDVAQPWATARGVNLQILDRVRRDGSTETLMDRLERDTRSVPIPLRMYPSGMPGNRSCTGDFKIKVISRWVKANGATAEHPADVLLGISTDEVGRLGNKSTSKFERSIYPLIDLGLSRADCRRIILAAGLPLPGKSACYFCPYTRPSDWANMRRDRPELFRKAADLEGVLIARRVSLGKPKMFLTRFGVPLADAIPLQPKQELLDYGTGPGETCDEGHCWT